MFLHSAISQLVEKNILHWKKKKNLEHWFAAGSYFTISFRIMFIKHNSTVLSFRNNVLSVIILHETANCIPPLKDWQDLNERCKTIYRLTFRVRYRTYNFDYLYVNITKCFMER